MGRLSTKKHYYVKSNTSRMQNENLLYQKRFVKVKKEDIKSFLIPVVKEIGKAIYPPAAIPIEILYQLYDHAGAINEVSSAVLDGDYKKAAKIIFKEGTKEAVETGLQIVGESTISTVADVSGEVASELTPVDGQQKEVIKNGVKGTINGVAEAISEKISDKLVDELVE